MHLPVRKAAAKQRFRGRRFIRRLEPPKAVTPAIQHSDDSLPRALPREGALGLCPLCGMPNGVTAKVCWRCEADLTVPAGLGVGVEQETGAKDPERSEQTSGTDRPDTQDATAVSPGNVVPGRAAALTDPVGPVALSELPRIASASTAYPTLTQVVQAPRPVTTLTAFAAVGHRPQRKLLVSAMVAALAIVVAGTYLYRQTSLGIDGSWTGVVANRQSETAVAPAAIGPANAERTRQPSTPMGLAQDAPPKVGESRSAMRGRSDKLTDAADVKAPVPALSRASDKDVSMAPSSATPLANAAPLTAVPRDKARSAARPAAAAIAVQKPDIIEQRRPAPEPRVPCTAAITALGLCEPP